VQPQPTPTAPLLNHRNTPQVSNFEFFLAAGTSYPPRNTDVHWSIVVSGDNCSPCQGLYSILK